MDDKKKSFFKKLIKPLIGVISVFGFLIIKKNTSKNKKKQK